MTRAPITVPSSTAASPTPPAAPSTSSVSLGLSWPRSFNACQAVPYATVNPAAAARSTPRGSGTVRAAGATHSSANAPNSTLATTGSPGFTCVTPPPVSFTTPASSTPGVNGRGGLIWYLPWIMRTSGKFTPAAFTSMTTSPAPARGDGTFSTTSASGPPHVLQSTAFIVVSTRSWLDARDFAAVASRVQLLGRKVPLPEGLEGNGVCRVDPALLRERFLREPRKVRLDLPRQRQISQAVRML